MSKFIKILLAEDNANDAELLLREMRHSGFEVVCERVDSEAEYVRRLAGNIDLVISDFEMPQFNGLRALELLKGSGLDIPFIIVSGTIGEDTAVAAMKQGAADYLLKDRLARLGQAVDHALEQSRNRAERREATKRIQASEERFRLLIENSSDVIVVIDQAGSIGYQSPSTQRTLGYELEELTGMSVYDLIHPDDKGKTDQGIQHALTNPDVPKPVEFRIRHRDGTWRIFESLGKCMTDSAGNVKIVINSRDITESRLLEEKFLRAQRMEAIGTLASGVAHDLNNILTPMLMVAGLLKETVIEQHDRDMLTLVERSAQRGASIISQLLTFSRGVEGARTSIQPRHLLKEMAHLIQETFPRNIELVQDIPSDLSNVVVDATQFHQVLMNLCVNARDAMKEGGKLTLTARNVELSEKEVQAYTGAIPGSYVLVTVSDTGHGIPAAIIDRIFDPFFTTKELGKGTGLGLSTVIGIIKSHKGIVNVYSEPGRGTAFRIYLPSADSGAGTERIATATPFSQGNGETILVVDDEPPILNTLRGLLEKCNYRVLTAGNGEEAIRLFIEHGAVVQLVVTDVMMPIMGGLALIKALRVLRPDIKFIATTGLERQEKTDDFAALGVSTILAKPFSVSALLQAVADDLNKKAQL